MAATRLDYATAFNHGSVTDRIYTSGGTPTASSTINRRTGGYSLEIGKTSGVAEYISLTTQNLAIANAFSRGTVVVYVQFQTLPSSISPIPVAYFNFFSGNLWRAGVGYRRDTGQFCFYTYNGVSPTAGSGVGPTVTTGQWYRLEFTVDFSTTTWTLQAGVSTDDTPLTDMGSTTLTVSSGAAGAITPNLVFGEQDAAADAWTINYCDVGFSTEVDVYPIGPIKVLGYAVNGAGTNNTDADAVPPGPSIYFFKYNGSTKTGLSSPDTDSYTYIDEVPIGSDANLVDIQRSSIAGTFTGSEMPLGCAAASSISSFSNPTGATGSPNYATGATYSNTNTAFASPAKRGSATLDLSSPDMANAANVTAITVQVRAAVSTSGVTGSTLQIDLYNGTTLVQSGTAQAANNTTFLDYSQAFSGFTAMDPSVMHFRITVSKGNSSTALEFAIDGIQANSYTGDALAQPGASQYVEYTFADESVVTDAPLTVSSIISTGHEVADNAISATKVVYSTQSQDGYSFINSNIDTANPTIRSAFLRYSPGVSGLQLSIDKTNNIQKIGTATTQTQVAQQFTNLYATSTIFGEFWIAKVGSPSDGLTAELWTDNGGGALAIPNTLVASSSTTIASSKFSTGPMKAVFTFSGLSLTAGTKYWVVIKRTGGGDDTNYYQMYMITGSGGTFSATLGEVALKTTSWANLTSTPATFCCGIYGGVLSITVLNGIKLRWGYSNSVAGISQLYGAYLEAAYPISVASVYNDSATLSTKTTPSGSDLAAFIETTTVSGVTTPSAVENAQRVDSGTVSSVTTPSGTDTYTKAPTLDAATVSGKTTPSSADTAQFVDAAAIGSSSSVSSAETAQDVDSNVIGSKTSVTSNDVSAGVDAQTVNGVTTPSGSDVAAFVDNGTAPDTTTVVSSEEGAIVDSATISSVTTYSGTDTYTSGAVDYLDSATTSTTTSVSSNEVASYVETVAAVATVTSLSGTDVVADVDASTISGTTTPSSNDVGATVDSATVNGVSSVSFVEVTPPDGGIVTSTTTPSTSDTAQYVDSGTSASVTSVFSSEGSTGYTDASTVSSQTTTTATDVSAFVDAATASSVTSAGSTDAISDSESATISGTTHLSSVEAADYVDSAQIDSVTSVISSDDLSHGNQDSNTAATNTSVSSVENAQFVDSAVIESDTIPSSVEIHDIPDSSTIAGVSTVISSDIYGSIDTATVSTKTAVSSDDAAQYVDLGTISGVTTPFGNEGSNSSSTDADTVATQTSLTPVEVFAGRDAGTISSSTTVSTTDQVAYTDAGLPSSQSSVLSTETTDYSDSGTITSLTTFTYSEVYEPPTASADSATIASVTTVTFSEGLFIIGAFALVGTLRLRWQADTVIGRLAAAARRRWYSVWRG